MSISLLARSLSCLQSHRFLCRPQPLLRRRYSVNNSDMTLFDTEKVVAGLETEALGRQIAYQHTVDTTMALAAEDLAANSQKAHGHVFVADEQIKGVARRGRSWLSPDSDNLYFSFVWAPAIAEGAALLQEMVKLNFCIGLATVDAVTAAGVTDARIKWPNDVMTPKGKLSGMLVNFDGRTGAVAGIGLNVGMNWTQTEHIFPATSISAELGGDTAAHPPREEIMACFCNALEANMRLPWAEVQSRYAAHDCLLGTAVRVHHASREESHPDDFVGQALRFDDSGALVVSAPDGSERTLTGEEVSVRPVAK